MKKRPKVFARPGKSNITLRNVLHNLRDDLHSENKQITQCVFLGVLKLKQVPSIFYSNNSFASAPIGRKLRIKRNRCSTKDTNKNPAKSIINKVISGRISKKDPATVKASIKKILPKAKFNMNNQRTTESSDLNSLRFNVTPEKVYTAQVVNLNSLTPTRQFNPVQNLFDKVKQKIGETQGNPSLSSADFEVNTSEYESFKKSKGSPKRYSKKKTDTDNNDDAAKPTTEKERTSPRNKKPINSDAIVIPDEVTVTSKVSETAVIDLIDDPSSHNKNLVTIQQKLQDSIDLTSSDTTATEKPKPNRRGRLIPTAIPSIYLTAPRLLRSELAQKKSNPTEQRFRERITKTKTIIKTKITEVVTPKPSRDRKVSGHEIIDDDILFVSEEVKSPNDGDKPSLKLLIRQKKKSELVTQELAKQTDIQEINLSPQSQTTNEPEKSPEELSTEETNKTSDLKLLRSTKQTTDVIEIKDQENINVSENCNKHSEENIELESEKQLSTKKNESKHNLKDAIKDDEGLDLQETNTTSAITENNNLSKTILEQIPSNINSDNQEKIVSVNMDSESKQEPSNTTSEIVQLNILTNFKEKVSSSEKMSTISVTRSLRSSPIQDSNNIEDENIFVDVVGLDDVEKEEIPTSEEVILKNIDSSEKKLRRSQRSVQHNVSEISSQETKVDKISSKADDDSTNHLIDVCNETSIKKSVKSMKFKNIDNNNCTEDVDDKGQQNGDVVEVQDSPSEKSSSSSSVEEVSKVQVKNKAVEKSEAKVTKNIKNPKTKDTNSKIAKLAVGGSKKRKAVNEKIKKVKQKVKSNSNVDNLNASELVNSSTRSLRSKNLSPYLVVNESYQNKSKKSKTNIKAVEKSKIKTKSNTPSTPKNVLVQPSTSNVQSKINKTRSTNSTAKAVSVTPKNKKQDPVEGNAKTPKKSITSEAKNNVEKHNKGKVAKTKEDSSKRQKVNVKTEPNDNPKKRGGKQIKVVVKREKQSVTPEQTKKTIQSKKKENVKKHTKLTAKSQVTKTKVNNKQLIEKITGKKPKDQTKGVLPKSLKSQQLLKALNKNKVSSAKKKETKKPIKIAKKTRLPLKVQNIISTRSRGIITLKDKKKLAKEKNKTNAKTVKKPDKAKQETKDSASSGNRNTSKLKQNKQTSKKVTTRGANKKQKCEESKKNPVAAKSKNVHKAKSLFIKRKKSLIERIIKSTLKQLDVQKQMWKSKAGLKAKAHLQRRRHVQNILNASKSVVKDVPEKPVVAPPIVVNTNIVQADSSVVDLQDQNDTIIFLTSDENCLIADLPVIENMPENIICLEVNDNQVTAINNSNIPNEPDKASLNVTRRSTRLVQQEVPQEINKNEKVVKQDTLGKRKRRIDIQVVNDVPVSSSESKSNNEEKTAKMRKVHEEPEYDDVVLTASEAVLRNLEHATSTVTAEKRKSAPPKGKDLTVFDFDESDPEQEAVPWRFKTSGTNRTDEQPSQSTMEISPENSQLLSPKKSPMKQATILEMFNKVAYKNEKTGFSKKSVITSTPKTSEKKSAQNNRNNVSRDDQSSSISTPAKVDLLAEQLMEFQRKCLKLNKETTSEESSKPAKKDSEVTIPPSVFRGLQRKCLQIHNISNLKPSDTSSSEQNAPAEKIPKKRLPFGKNVKIEEEPVSNAKSNKLNMPPPTKHRVVKKTVNPDEDDIFDEDDSRSEWMPQELAEYKFKYSAKKVMSYKPVFKCKVCLEIFPTYYKLGKHKKKHIETKNPYACKHCDDNFNNLEDLVAHIRVHKGQHPYVCQKCDSGFWSKKAYDAHLPVHLLRKTKEAPKKFECDNCKKKFAKLCDVERHSRVHTGEKPFICNICNKSFQQTHNLSKHLLIHLHLKPFNCEICGKKFGRIDVLNRHVLTHSLIKPIKCCLCPKDFIRVSQLNHHYKKEHPDYVNTELASQFASSSDANTTEATVISNQASSSQSEGELIAELEVNPSDSIGLTENEVVEVLS